MLKKKVIQIIIPLLIVVVIAGIWMIKKSTDEKTSPDLETPLEITEISLEEITSRGLPVIIDFGSDSCIPCREMAPALKAINEEMQGKAIVHYIDVWEYPDSARGFPVQVIPTQIFFTAEGKPYVPSEDFNMPFTMYADSETNEHIFTVHEGGLTESQMRFILMDMGVDAN